MLNDKGFDLWANEYDVTVKQSEESNSYPFAGYRGVLNFIYDCIRSGSGKKVLDVGFGTGVLAGKLYEDGYSVYGIDFSEKMIEIAKGKMPGATLLHHDFSKGYPEALKAEKFDYIVCTYAIHHLDHPAKAALIRELVDHLTPDGKVLIGDVAFATAEELDQCQRQSGNDWDKDEIYPLAEELRRDFPAVEFTQISFCAGVLTFGR